MYYLWCMQNILIAQTCVASVVRDPHVATVFDACGLPAMDDSPDSGQSDLQVPFLVGPELLVKSSACIKASLPEA